jgi:hypothetical protein
VVISSPKVRRQCAASTVRAVAVRYARTSGLLAVIRIDGSAVMNTCAVRSSASGRLATLAYISR